MVPVDEKKIWVLRKQPASRSKRWARASTAPNKKRLALCLRGPSIFYYGAQKPQSPVGGFWAPLKRREGRGGWVGVHLTTPHPPSSALRGNGKE